MTGFVFQPGESRLPHGWKSKKHSGDKVVAKESYFRREIIFKVVSQTDYTEYIENLVESIDLDIFVVDRKGIITVWNRKIENRLGKKEKAIGQPLLKVLHRNECKNRKNCYLKFLHWNHQLHLLDYLSTNDTH